MKMYFVILSIFTCVASGCSLFSGLRGERFSSEEAQRETPTVGGMWPEGSLLDRNPAMETQRAEESSNGWVSQVQEEVNQRDAVRRLASSYDDNPNMPPVTRRLYKNGDRATKEDFIDNSENEGSLWASTGDTNYFFTKNKVKGMGDIVSITIEDALLGDVGKEVQKTLDEAEVQQELEAAQLKIAQDAKAGAAKGGDKAAGAAKKEEASSVEEAEVREANFADINVIPSLGIKSGEPMMGEIIDRYPNGNYKIRATKRIPYRGTVRLLNLVAVAKASDVNDSETITSGKLYEYRLAVFK